MCSITRCDRAIYRPGSEVQTAFVVALLLDLINSHVFCADVCYRSSFVPPRLFALSRPNLLAISLMLLLFDRCVLISNKILLNL